MDPMPNFEKAAKRKRRRSGKPNAHRNEADGSGKVAWIVGGLLIAVSLLGAFLIGREYAPAENSGAAESASMRALPNSEALAPAEVESPERSAAMKSFDEGMNAFSRNELNRARTAFSEALKIDPTFPGVYYQLARISSLENDGIEALEDINRSLDRGENIQECYRLKAAMMIRAGSNDNVYEEFERAAQASPEAAEIFFEWGEALRKDGKLRESIEKLEQAARRSVNQAVGVTVRIKLELAYAELGTGGPELDRLLALREVAPETWMGAAARALKQGKGEEAISYLAEARASMNESFYRWAISDPFFDLYRSRPEFKEALTPGAGERIRPENTNRPIE